MPERHISILSTRKLGRELIREARSSGILITELEFIQTEPITSVYVQQEVERSLTLTATAVFTSMNAVEAVASFLMETVPDWKIYCTGSTTKRLAEQYFGVDAIAGTAATATELANEIIEDGDVEEVIFFCGSRRRDELPSILREHKIDVSEVEVYRTIPLHHSIGKEFAGVLFFSPSAVESFFATNSIEPRVVLFAVGNTTATEIKKYCTNPVIVAHEPGKENLVQEMIRFLSST